VMSTDTQNVEDLVQLAKFLEDFGMKEAAIRKGREVFKLGRLDLLRKAGFKSIAAVQPAFPPRKPVFKNEDRKNHMRSTPRKIAPRSAPRHESNTGLDLDENSDEALSGTNGPTGGQPPERSSSSRRPFEPQKFGRQMPGSFESSFIRTFQPVDDPQFSKSATVRYRLSQAAAKRPAEMQAARDVDLRIKDQFKTMKELEETVDTGDHLATAEWMNAASEMIAEFMKFKLFFMDRNLPFAGYFRRRGDWWKDAAITELASFANRIDSGGKLPPMRRYDRC
jgi:general transcription factor 3C polypeptide 3 (transcription factor C subunit 4)